MSDGRRKRATFLPHYCKIRMVIRNVEDLSLQLYGTVHDQATTLEGTMNIPLEVSLLSVDSPTTSATN